MRTIVVRKYISDKLKDNVDKLDDKVADLDKKNDWLINKLKGHNKDVEETISEYDKMEQSPSAPP